MLLRYPCNCPYLILCICRIVTACHTPKNILSGQGHIKNWYCNNLARHLCTTLGTLAYDSNNFCISLKYDSKVNYDPHKYLMNFPMAHITVADSTTKIYLHFYIGDTVDVEMKEIGRRRIPSRDLSNSHLTL